ncbi:hypothetical protein GBF38_008177 [Nibea albiflora]|uniref:Uncharacterized protein n=1 Tax=Nibea albiflora TaxID=240163 RepID=A0ACB7EPG4_NIBAL|nr:hypothetical protein GBF38_008177 [Nibea albiflora]
MSENTQKMVSVSGNAFSREIFSKNFERLSSLDQKLFLYGPLYLGGNAGLAGLISNSLYRRALNVTQAPIASSMPMAMLPFMTTFALYNALVSNPLLAEELNCPSCAMLRGALVGVVGGAVYPILLALPVNLGLASKYNTAPMPEKGNMLRYFVDISRPILRKMRAVLLLQALFGTYLGSRHFQSYAQLVEKTFGSGPEELQERKD